MSCSGQLKTRKQCSEILLLFNLLGVAAVDLVGQDWGVSGEHRGRHRLRVQGARLVAGGPAGLQ